MSGMPPVASCVPTFVLDDGHIDACSQHPATAQALCDRGRHGRPPGATRERLLVENPDQTGTAPFHLDRSTQAQPALSAMAPVSTAPYPARPGRRAESRTVSSVTTPTVPPSPVRARRTARTRAASSGTRAAYSAPSAKRRSAARRSSRALAGGAEAVRGLRCWPEQGELGLSKPFSAQRCEREPLIGDRLGGFARRPSMSARDSVTTSRGSEKRARCCSCLEGGPRAA
jgi:hypothetical protein